ncbi:hypothetical protein I0C86_28355 [Plantactinospora sp. S1510]|uniref:Uncharacterized protein n=1 Tax=Plantactinospora alkalitolerans TaxID=2789879 RepID=A0ABS0H2Z5_9ACTN|nr:hypothetical protein [Plantactinospora alkalitolerans]MBF9132840.1 hypothetical protein [Plantactinospora alkalitolerans]
MLAEVVVLQFLGQYRPVLLRPGQITGVAEQPVVLAEPTKTEPSTQATAVWVTRSSRHAGQVAAVRF